MTGDAGASAPARRGDRRAAGAEGLGRAGAGLAAQPGHGPGPPCKRGASIEAGGPVTTDPAPAPVPAAAPVVAPPPAAQAPPPPPAVPVVAPPPRAPVAEAAPRTTGAQASPESASIRVPIEKVDRLINLVGELVSTQSMVA